MFLAQNLVASIDRDEVERMSLNDLEAAIDGGSFVQYIDEFAQRRPAGLFSDDIIKAINDKVNDGWLVDRNYAFSAKQPAVVALGWLLFVAQGT